VNEPDTPAPSPEKSPTSDGGKMEPAAPGTPEPQPAKGPTRAQALGCVVLLVILVGLGVGAWWLTTSGVRSRLAEADRLWTEGQKAEAVKVYQKHADEDLRVIYGDDRVKVFQRLVEYDLEQGDIASAKAHLDKAAKQKVILPPDVAQRVQDREGQLAAERAKKVAADREEAAQAGQERKEAAQKAEQEKKRQAEAAALKKKLEKVPDLLRRLKDENGQVRALAASELAEIKPLPPEALEPLLVAVNDSGDLLSIAIRTSAIKALGNCDPSDKSVKALEALLNDETIAVQTAALQALKESAKSGLPAVTKALAHPNPLIRGQAARILADSGEAGKKSVPDLLKAMKEEQEEGTQVWMAGAIVKLDPEEPAPIPVLTKALDPGRAAATRKTAAEFLAEAGPRAQAAIPALEAMVKGGNAAEATAVRKALEKIKQ
jgi:HEAT repeat protein